MNNYFVNVRKSLDIPANIGRGNTIAVKDEISVQRILDSYKDHPKPSSSRLFSNMKGGSFLSPNTHP